MTTGVILRILACFALFATGALVNGWRMSAQVAKCEAQQSRGQATRAEAARADETETAIKESKHAQDTIYNADRLANLKTGIADVQRRELGHFERLQHGAASRAATYNAQAQADAAARADLADLARTLDGRVTDGLRVVAKLQGRLGERDADAAALCRQVNIERRLSGDDSDQACSHK